MNAVVFVTGLVSLLTDLSSEMIVPVLPLFLTTVLHVQVTSIGLLEGIAESTASILKLFSGWFSDKLGKRKPLMVFGYGLSNLIKPLFALSTSFSQVLAIRFIDRFGKGMRGAPRDALIADSTSKEERGKAFGFHRAMDTLGAAIGPFVAFFVLSSFHENYRLIFWISSIPGIIAVLLLIFFLKEKKKTNIEEEIFGKQTRPKISFKGLDRRFILFTFIATLFAIGNSSDAFLILRAQDVGMNSALIPLAYFAFNIVYTLFSIPAGILSDRLGRRPIIVTGYLIFALIYLGFGLITKSLWVWGLFILYGLYYATTEGVQKAYIADLVPEGKRGTAIGTFNALTGIAALPASLLAGFLWETFGPASTFAVSSGFAALSAILMVLLRV